MKTRSHLPEIAFGALLILLIVMVIVYVFGPPLPFLGTEVTDLSSRGDYRVSLVLPPLWAEHDLASLISPGDRAVAYGGRDLAEIVEFSSKDDPPRLLLDMTLHEMPGGRLSYGYQEVVAGASIDLRFEDYLVSGMVVSLEASGE